MAIEKRKTPSGKIVGWDTVRKCYCKLPKDAEVPESRFIDYSDERTVPKLRELAEAEGVDLGDVTRRNDIIDLINEHYVSRG